MAHAPLRIPLGGGGTDLPSYYRRSGGFVLTAAIDVRLGVAIVPARLGRGYTVRCPEPETTAAIEGIGHPIVRTAFALHDVGPCEIVSMCDVPGGTGLGSSGSFTVALLAAIHRRRGASPAPAELAEQACHLEIERLGRAVGKQDQYVAALGGFQCLDLRPDGMVRATALRLDPRVRARLDERLLLFYTGLRRDAAAMLDEQHTRSVAGDAAMLDGLDTVRRIGADTRDALEAGDLDGFAALLEEHWQHKRKRSTAMSNDHIDRWHDLALEHGARGGKLVGAGGGGFLLFYTEDPPRLRAAMRAEGLVEMPFAFTDQGVRACSA
ncbi:GHMP family kinase ATP-binding protein [Nocardia takedensis]